MIAGGADAEGLCNLTKSVWNNCIYEKSDIETNKYTKANGKFYDDFNDALSSLYSDDSTLQIIDSIEENQKLVESIMRELQSPPDGLQTCYDTVTELYNVYKQITNLAISPEGSLKTYSDNFSTYDSDFMKYYDQLGLQIPEE